MNNKQRIIGLIALAALIIAVITAGIIVWDRSDNKTISNGQIAVDINEINHQIDNGDVDGAKKSLNKLTGDSVDSQSDNTIKYVVLGASAVLIVAAAFTYIYVVILKPFDKLNKFASKVASGDLDVPLDQERGQFFGKFTWAFDSMRKEIKKARDAEQTAIDNNKTVIATLSHDIKTPISSIRTYCEALEANLDKTPERRTKYLNTIIDKCDEVGRLTDDLFVHSVSDMNQLSVSPAKIELGAFMSNAVELLSAEDTVVYRTDISEDVYIKADPSRLTQILENLVANSAKYAGTKVDIYSHLVDGKAVIEVRDYGKGIPEENMPFITQKFYRGNNVEGIQGSGLGLYICNYLADKMDAEFELQNVYAEGKDSICEGLVGKIKFDVVS